MTNTKEKRFEETWYKLLSMVEKDHKLTASKFYKSVSVDKTGFIAWMSSHGYGNTFPEVRGYIIKQLKGQSSVNVNLQEVEKQTLISNQNGSLTKNTKEIPTESPQYWWLNITPEIWNIKKANVGDEKTISFFERGQKKDNDFDGQFLKWLYCYLIELKNNSCFGRPIAQRELAISLLDFCNIPVDEKSLKSTYKRIGKYLRNYLPPIYELDPPVVLLTPTDRDNGYRRCAAWQHPLNPDGTIQTDEDGNRLPRELIKTASYSRTYYFYRKSNVPCKPYNQTHNSDPNYVQQAPDEDVEKNSQICKIRPFSHANIGDLVLACNAETESQHFVAMLRITAVGEDRIDFRIVDIFNKTCSTTNLEEPYCDYCKGSESNKPSFFNLEYIEAKEIIKVIEKVMKRPIKNNDNINTIKYHEYIDLLIENKNIILTGAPGTGKTHIAQSVAKEMGAETEFIQFHPSYDYSDFVEGLRPIEKGKDQIGFERRDGVFKHFCSRAVEAKFSDEDVETQDKTFVFIIDEINRGEVSKIFGELFYAIDPGYRGKKEYLVQTQYQNLVPRTDVFYEGFYVPDNVYIIGTMNDIDRSVENMDFAMRRRFTFIEVTPSDSEYILDSLGCAEEAKATMKRLNDAIEKTEGLGGAYMIGPAYFLKLGLNGGDFSKLWKMSIEPLLKEYLRGFRRSSEILKKFNETYFDKKKTTKKRQSTDED